jgi:predicted metal-dependent HD superfamily phosphohydrolase
MMVVLAKDIISDFSLEALRERFRLLWGRCLLTEDLDNSEVPVFAELARLYSEPSRFYHGWTHLLDCLDQLDLAAMLLDDPDAVEMALWFHDAVYEPGASDNEQKSAELFGLLAGEYFPPAFSNKIHEYILLTRHQEAPGDLDGGFMVDVDLSSFAANWDKFLQDSYNIRSENDYLADDEFYPKQIGFLQSLLERQRIFFSDHFYTQYEGIARLNITRFLAKLRSRDTVV